MLQIQMVPSFGCQSIEASKRAENPIFNVVRQRRDARQSLHVELELREGIAVWRNLLQNVADQFGESKRDRQFACKVGGIPVELRQCEEFKQ